MYISLSVYCRHLQMAHLKLSCVFINSHVRNEHEAEEITTPKNSRKQPVRPHGASGDSIFTSQGKSLHLTALGKYSQRC
jgi:hypothetical protein